MAKTAADVMERSVITVDRATSLADAHRLFVEEEIHGAPVVNDEGAMEGVLTTTDILRAIDEEHDSAAFSSDYLRGLVEFSAPDWGGDPQDFQDRMGNLTVGDAMTEGAICVAPSAPISEVAEVLRKNRIHRVWVTDGDRLCGVVSTFDLLPLLEG